MFDDNKPMYELRGPWGVPVQFAGSFLFLFLFYGFGAETPRDFAYDMAFVAMLIVSIFLHELGHAWGCLIQGIRVRRIMMHGGGGFCERSVSASRYEQEFIVAMGPIVTIGLWAIATLAFEVLFAMGVPYNNTMWVLDTMAWINLFLFIFNMIPMQPLDGGKLFELVLHRFLPSCWAVKIAGIVSLTLIAAWVPMMLFGYDFYGLVLLLIPAVGLSWEMAKTKIRPRGDKQPQDQI